MRLYAFLMMLGLSFGAIAAPVQPFRLMMYGDSLAAGYGLKPQDAFYNKLEQALLNKGYDVEVINTSKSGETTAGGLNRQASAINEKPDAVLLELGVNDAIQGVDISTIRDNLNQLIETFNNNHIPVMLVGMQAPPTRPLSYQQQFAQLYRDLAREYNLILYPFFMKGIFRRVPGVPFPVSDKVLSDNAHPNAEGVDVMVDGILPDVERFLNSLDVGRK